MSRRCSVYERIIRAAGRGRGLRLSAEEVRELSLDQAICDAAEGDGTCSLCLGTGKLDDGRRPNCVRGSFLD